MKKDCYNSEHDKGLKSGFSLIEKKDIGGWLDLPKIRDGGYLDKAKKQLKEEYYPYEVDKSLLDKLAIYKAVMDVGDEEIISGRQPMDSLELGTSRFSKAYRWAEIRYFKTLEMVRAQLPKTLNLNVNFGDFVNNLPD